MNDPTTTRRRHPGWIFALLFLGTAVAAAQSDRWAVDGSGDHATGAGMGGGLIYSCAPGAPSGGAVAAVFRGVSIPDGHYAGAIGDTETRLRCVNFAGNLTCFVAVPRDVAPIRDALTQLASIIFRVGSARDPLGAGFVVLLGAAQTIDRVRLGCP